MSNCPVRPFRKIKIMFIEQTHLNDSSSYYYRALRISDSPNSVYNPATETGYAFLVLYGLSCH